MLSWQVHSIEMCFVCHQESLLLVHIGYKFLLMCFVVIQVSQS